MTETIIHCNMGKTTEGEPFRLQLPPPRIASVTGAFALSSGISVGAVQCRLGGE